MEATWIEDQRQQLKNKYHLCKDQNGREPVLEAFSIYLLKILNGLAQMKSSKLYGYEAQILGEAMRLFCIHYISQVDDALKPEIGIENKKEIIGDIEDAISKISSVYKNVIDSTSDSDRQMFTSQAVESSIYDISPKLLATYSAILETLVYLFKKRGIYAFLLHPSLKSNIETAGLFDMREKEGKVVLIYIPENEIEKISQIPMYLLHEAFHVLTKEQRNRKDRACRMEIHVLNAISQRIFKNVDFSFINIKDDYADEKVKKKLLEKWFDTNGRIQELKNLEWHDRRFYSKNVLKQICENWRNWLSEIFVTLGADLCEVLNEQSFCMEENPYKKMMQIEWEIQRNLVEILTGNIVAKYAKMYMSIYREAYADIACILTAGISPEEYENAFRNSEIINDVLEKDIIRSLRIYFVAKAVVSCENVTYAEEWKKYCEENDFRKQKMSGDQVKTDNQRDKNENNNDRIRIYEDDLKSFEQILINCSAKLWDALGKQDSSFAKFRNIISNMNFVEILNGKVNEKLHELCME